MIKLLSKIFIKNNDAYHDAGVRRAYGMLCSVVGIFLNVLLFTFKYLAGVLSGSVAITADAFNNLSDAGSSVITLFGFRLSGKRPDKDHPYGHGRIEYISGLAVSAIIIVMGVELFKTSVGRIVAPEPVEMSTLSVLILVFSILGKGYMAFYNSFVGRKIDSAAMRATAADSLSDVLSTALVLASVLIAHFANVNIDGWCGLLVAAFILYSGFNSMKDTVSPLLGKAPEPEFVKSVEEIVMAHEEVEGIHDLVVHDYGPGRVFVSLHAEVSAAGDIIALHDTIDLAERELRNKLGCEAVIHMDPISTDDERVTELKRRLTEELRVLDGRLSVHDFRMVEGPTHTNLIFDVAVPVDFPLSDGEVSERIESLVSCWGDYFAVITIDKSYI